MRRVVVTGMGGVTSLGQIGVDSGGEIADRN